MTELEQPVKTTKNYHLSDHRARVLASVALYGSFVGVLCIGSTISAALVDIAYKYEIGLSKVGFVPTLSAVFYILGSILGGLVYDKLIRLLLWMSLFCVVILSSLVTAPLMPNVIVFGVMIVISSSFSGALDVFGQPYILALWKGTKYRDSVMQGLHATWSLGAAIMGFIVQNFLDPNLQRINQMEFQVNNSTNVSSNSTTTNNEYQGKVSLGFITMSSIGILPTLMLCAASFIIGENNSWKKKLKTGKDEQETTCKVVDLPIKQKSCLILIGILMRLTDTELFIATFIASYLFYGLNMSTPQGAIAFSFFFGGQCTGRFLAVFASCAISPYKILTINSIVIILSNIIFILFGETHPAVAYGCAAMFGFGNSSSFPSLYLWLSSFMEITGVVSGLMFLGDLSLLMAPLYAYLIEKVKAQYFVYHIFAAVALNLTILNIGKFLGNKFVSKQRSLSNVLEINEDEQNEVKITLTNNEEEQKCDSKDKTCNNTTN